MGYLVTKTTSPPVRSCIVPWHRLTDCLWAGLERRLTLVVSVAGSGKTTCLGDFARTIAKSQWRTAWLSLDAGDNDPSRFWMYFLAALNEVDPGMQLSIGSASLGSQAGDCSYLDEPLNRVATAPFDLYFVLDDYHMIQSESVHASVIYWIEHMPANMHLAIASRNTPPLPLSRLRGQDQLVEIHSKDLFFDFTGTVDFLRRVKGLDVSTEDAMALFELTGGWVAGLQLATISMQSRGEAQGLVRDFSRANRHIWDFLIDEVLNQQSDATRAFLLETSILNRLTAPLCEAITGDRRSQETLYALVEADLFLVPLDDFGEWYRYHPLFSEALKQYLVQVNPDDVARLYTKASEWTERNGFVEDAIEYALLADNSGRVVQLLEQHLFVVVKKQKGVRLTGWLQGLPYETYRDSLSYLVLNAWANFTSAHPKKSRTWLERAGAAA